MAKLQNDEATCGTCGGPLRNGFLLGHHFRIRWSEERHGLTVFHGRPLIKRPPRFLLTARWWFTAPSIPARRCERCKQVTFEYTEDAPESPMRDRIASGVLAGILLATVWGMAFALVWISGIDELPTREVVMFCVLGGVFLIMAIVALLFAVRRRPGASCRRASFVFQRRTSTGLSPRSIGVPRRIQFRTALP